VWLGSFWSSGISRNEYRHLGVKGSTKGRFGDIEAGKHRTGKKSTSPLNLNSFAGFDD